MSDYFRDRFPLAETSTLYMDGTAIFNLVRYNKPGIIKPIRLTGQQADAFRDAVREAREETWDEAYRQAWSDAQDAHDVRQEMSIEDWPHTANNPFRKQGQQ